MKVCEIIKLIYKNGQKVDRENIPSTFADYFNEKVQNIVNETQIDPNNVHNSKRKLTAPSEHFMQIDHVRTAVKSQKLKTAKNTLESPKEYY